jgi:hypothetical protein
LLSSKKKSADQSPLITLRALALGALTILAVFYYLILGVGHGSGSGSYVRSQFPMVAFMPFVLWLFLNAGLKRVSPRLALRRGELLTIFSMLWVVGALPQWGWSDYWIAITAAPIYLATPENQWTDLLFPYLPWHALPNTSSRVLDTFWLGLPEGAAVPWDGWTGAVFQWLGASLGMVVFGFCLVVLFQRQWAEAEKLTFPLAQMPLDLTRGFDGPRRVPDLFCSGLFWIGFAVVFLPLLYNIATYFTPGLPLFELYTKRFPLELPRPFPGLTIRVLPLVLALTYLCPLDILGSIVFFVLLATFKIGTMERIGVAVGDSGQSLGAGEILSLESFGAIVFVAGWSVWLARGHLRQVWFQVRTGQGDRRDVRLYRLALAGLLLSALYVIAWACSLGASLPLAAGAFALMALTFFVTIKLIAATGFPYLMPSWPNAKGGDFITELIGSAHLSTQDLVAFKMFTSNAFFGNIRLLTWPAIPHHLRIFSLREHPWKVTAVVLVAFLTGFLVAVWASLEVAYDKGGATFLMGAVGVYDQTTHLLQNPRVGSPGKWGVWLWGIFAAWGLALLRARLHWFPLHPIGLAFQYTSGTSIYWFSLFLVWIVKLTLLRYGGIKAYRKGKPFFYGLGIGYVVGVVLSGVVDVIWFPLQGHSVHDW